MCISWRTYRWCARAGHIGWLSGSTTSNDSRSCHPTLGKLSLTAPAWLSICGMWTLCNNENTAFGISPVICNKMRFTCEYVGKRCYTSFKCKYWRVRGEKKPGKFKAFAVWTPFPASGQARVKGCWLVAYLLMIQLVHHHLYHHHHHYLLNHSVRPHMFGWSLALPCMQRGHSFDLRIESSVESVCKGNSGTVRRQTSFPFDPSFIKPPQTHSHCLLEVMIK